LRLAADVIVRHVRANEIEVNAERGRNPKKKSRMYEQLFADESNKGPSRSDI